MKKIILLLFVSAISFASFAANPHISIYIDCGDGPKLYNLIPKPLYSNTSGYIEGYFNDLTICHSCKITYKITGSMEGHEEIFTYNNNRAYFEDGTFIYFDYATDFNAFSGKSIKSLYTSGTSGVYGFPGIMLHFNNLNILPSTSKDKIQIDNKQICKGACPTIGSLVTPNDKVDIVSYGCGLPPLVPSGIHGWNTLHNNAPECFNEVGSFPICITVKDACGIKELRKNIEVVDCSIKIEQWPVTNCETCCSNVFNMTTDLKNLMGFNKNRIFGDITARKYGCAEGHFEVTFADGTSLGFTGNYDNNTGKKIVKLCYKLSCNLCPEVCIDID